MAVSQVGSVITITSGTETGVGTFSGLSGVTITTDAMVQKCDLGTNTLVVASGATLNLGTTQPEQLFFVGDVNHNVHNILVNGTLNIGGHTYSPANVPSYNFGQPAIVENNIYGGSPYTEDDQAAYLNQGAGDGGRLSSFYVANSGTLNLSKAGISIGGAFGAHSSSVVTIADAEISAMQKYIFSTTYNISNTDIFTFGSGSANGTGNVSMVCNPVTWDNVGGAMSAIAYLSGSSSTPVGSPITIRNTPTLPVGVSLLRSGSGTGSKPEFSFYNNVDGADVTYSIELGRAFRSRIYKEFNLSSASIAGATPETKTIYVGATGTDVEVVYTDTSATQEFLLRDTDKPFNVAVTDTFYDKGGDGSSLIDVHTIAYGYLIDTKINVDLKGSGIKEIETTYIPNLSTTADKATVAAYLFIDDGYKLSDALELYLWDNFNKEQSYFWQRTGSAIDLTGYTVTLDKTAVDLITVSGTTVTVKCDTYNGLIICQELILANGAVQTGGVQDINGDSYATFDIGDVVTIYPTHADRKAETNELVSISPPEIFRFTFSGGTTYYASILTGTTTIFYDFTPTSVGEYTANLDQTGQLTAINASIKESSGFARYGGSITVDLISGTNSTEDGFGTPEFPTSSIANAIVLSASKGLKTFEVRGDLTTLPQKLVGYELIAGVTNSAGASIVPAIVMTTLNDADRCVFDGFAITGASDVTSVIEGNKYKNCYIANFSGATGLASNCKLAGSIQVEHSLDVVDNSYGTVNFSVSGTNAKLNVPSFSGDITISNITGAGARVNIGVVAGKVTIDSSCTNASAVIVVANADEVVNNTGGTQVEVLNDSGGGGGDSASTIYSYFTTGTRADAFKADVSSIPTNPLLTNDARLDNLDVAISTRLPTSMYVAPDNAGIAAIPTNPLLTTDVRLDNLDTAISTRLASSSYITPPTVLEIDAQLTSSHGSGSWQQGVTGTVSANIISVNGTAVTGVDDFKTDVSGLSTLTSITALQSYGDLNWTTATGFSTLDIAGVQTALSNYGTSTFNPSSDVVANVSLVDTCTTNSDMRGTDGANTVAPDNATISSISATTELIRKYHDNASVFLSSDQSTKTTQSSAYYTVVYDDDGVTPLKTVMFTNSAGNPTTLPDATGYEKL